MIVRSAPGVFLLELDPVFLEQGELVVAKRFGPVMLRLSLEVPGHLLELRGADAERRVALLPSQLDGPPLVRGIPLAIDKGLGSERGRCAGWLLPPIDAARLELGLPGDAADQRPEPGPNVGG